jgi:hypothetical protein
MATAKPSNLMLIAVGVREDGNNLISNEARVACRVTPVSDDYPLSKFDSNTDKHRPSKLLLELDASELR